MTINSVQRFSTKAQLYARYRWEYAPESIDALVRTARLRLGAPIADIGSGTGALCRPLLQAGMSVIGIEPNAEMRRIAEEQLVAYPNFTSRDALSDATGLADHSVELVTIGRALHWLPAQSTRREIQRILTAGGWLAILGVSCSDKELTAAIQDIQTEVYGWDVAGGKVSQPHFPLAFYFGGDHFQELHFPANVQETWTQFLGRLLSFSSAPDPGSALYTRYERAARTIFDRFSVNDRLSIAVSTDMSIGQVL
jgi:SAM-dependent methyltransferase